MGPDQVFLELGAVFFRNMYTAQGAESGGYSVDHPVTVDDIINQGTGGFDAGNCIRIKGQFGTIPADSDQLFQSQVIPGQDNFFNGFDIFQ